jgi:hypothetical protein
MPKFISATAQLEKDFERIKTTMCGSFRTECDEYVIIGHCSNYQTIEQCLINHTMWYISIYQHEKRIDLSEFKNLDFETLLIHAARVIGCVDA